MKKIARILMVVAFTLFIAGAFMTTDASAKTVKLSKKAVTLNEKGATAKIKLKNATGSVKWASSDKTVAKVSNGKITAVHSGSCYVTATNNKKTYKCKVTVKYDGELTFYYEGTDKILNYQALKFQISDKYSINIGKGSVVSSNESVLAPNEDMDLCFGDSLGTTILTVTKNNGSVYKYKTSVIESALIHQDFDIEECNGYTNYLDSGWEWYSCNYEEESNSNSILIVSTDSTAVAVYDEKETKNDRTYYWIYNKEFTFKGISLGDSLSDAMKVVGYGNLHNYEMTYLYKENGVNYLLSFYVDSNYIIQGIRFYKAFGQ